MGRANHFCSRALGRAGQGSDRPQTCGLRARFPDCLSTHRFAGFDGQQSGRECIFPFRTDPQFSMVVPHLRTALACFAHRARASCASSIRNGRLAAPGGLQYSLAHWAYYGLFPPQAAAFVRPSPVSAEILWISGRGNCKEAIFALENGIFRRKNRPVPAVHAAGDD